MNADPLPLRRKRTPPPPAVTVHAAVIISDERPIDAAYAYDVLDALATAQEIGNDLARTGVRPSRGSTRSLVDDSWMSLVDEGWLSPDEESGFGGDIYAIRNDILALADAASTARPISYVQEILAAPAEGSSAGDPSHARPSSFGEVEESGVSSSLVARSVTETLPAAAPTDADLALLGESERDSIGLSIAESVRLLGVTADANDNESEAAHATHGVGWDRGDAVGPQSTSDSLTLKLAASRVTTRPSAEVAVVQNFLEEVGASQFQLTMRIYQLERLARTAPKSPATDAAMKALGKRVFELDMLRNALNELYLEAAAPEIASALAHDGVVREYLRGTYAWADSVLRALEILNGELRLLAPDWFRMRARLTDARDFYLLNLEDEVRRAVDALNRGQAGEAGSVVIIHDLGNKLEDVIDSARVLLKGVERRFA